MQWFIRGISAHKMSSNLAKRMNNSYMNAQRVVMTESAHVLNKASLMAYMDNGVDKVEFLAVLDGKTSAVCFNLNGDVIPIKDAVPGKNIPPLHPHCRSTIIPVVDEGIDNNENSGKIEVENLLPNHQNALIPEEKLLDCYLNKQHPTGKDKAIAVIS